MSNKIQDIFTGYYPIYEKKYKVPLHCRRAAWNIINCRTDSMGAHVFKCTNDNYEKIQYNSCKHRACRQCSQVSITKWIEKQLNKVLDTDHYHVIFTIPHAYNDIWLLNTEEMTNILFKSASKAVNVLAKDDRYIGAKPGMIAALHTWGKTLILHPHLHMLITGGGIDENNRWIKCKKGYIFPTRALMILFRSEFNNSVHQGLYNRELRIPKGKRYKEYQQIAREQGKKKWNVHIKNKYLNGKGVIKYLGAYIKGGPVGEKRIERLNFKEIVLKYSDNTENGKSKQINLKPEEFIRRYFLHVPKKGTKVVRYYGIYATTCLNKLNECRKQLGQLSYSVDEISNRLEVEKAKNVCPVCGEKLVTRKIMRNIEVYKKNKVPIKKKLNLLVSEV